MYQGFPCGSEGEESACNAGDLDSILGLRRSPGGGHGDPLQYSCLENPHGQRRLAGYSPWGLKESDTTERLTTVWQSMSQEFPVLEKRLQTSQGTAHGDQRWSEARSQQRGLAVAMVAWHALWFPHSSHQGMRYPPLIPLWVPEISSPPGRTHFGLLYFGVLNSHPLNLSLTLFTRRGFQVMHGAWQEQILSLKKGRRRSGLYIQWNATWS